MPTRDDALALADAGWAVLPLHGKLPLTPHGVRDATTDPEQVSRWWANGAKHNIGARVPASLLVLDFDPQNGGSVEDLESATGEPLPETLTVISGRGTGGQHRYFLHPGGTTTGRRLPQGIDIKTATGYCVMPPSVHPASGRAYRWEVHTPQHLPGAVRALLIPATPMPRRRSGAPAPEKALHLVRYVSQLGEGNRNAGLYWAACRAVEERHSGEVFDMLEGAAVAAGLSEDEARRTVASARRKAVSS